MKERNGSSRVTDDMLNLLDEREKDLEIKDYLQSQIDKGLVTPEFVDVPPEYERDDLPEWLDTGLTKGEHLHLSFIIWLKLARRYLENPDDWTLAYHFIQCHPIFWRRNEYKDGSMWDWDTDTGHNGFWVSVSGVDNPGVLLEHGPTVAPEYNRYYHDYKMDVWAPTFEEAYVKYAKNVHAKYTLDGYEREDTDGSGEEAQQV